MSVYQKAALIITIFGALILGVVGIFNFNFITFLFGNASFLTRLVYIIIGLAGIINIGLLSTGDKN